MGTSILLASRHMEEVSAALNVPKSSTMAQSRAQGLLVREEALRVLDVGSQINGGH
jgi:hypothetical protein